VIRTSPPPESSTPSLHDALPICDPRHARQLVGDQSFLRGTVHLSDDHPCFGYPLAAVVRGRGMKTNGFRSAIAGTRLGSLVATVSHRGSPLLLPSEHPVATIGSSHERDCDDENWRTGENDQLPGRDDSLLRARGPVACTWS